MTRPSLRRLAAHNQHQVSLRSLSVFLSLSFHDSRAGPMTELPFATHTDLSLSHSLFLSLSLSLALYLSCSLSLLFSISLALDLSCSLSIALSISLALISISPGRHFGQ